MMKSRNFSREQTTILYNLYHIARTALSGEDDSVIARAFWASKEFVKLYPDASRKAAYLTLI